MTSFLRVAFLSLLLVTIVSFPAVQVLAQQNNSSSDSIGTGGGSDDSIGSGGSAPSQTQSGTRPTLVNPLSNIDSLPALLRAILRAIVEIGVILLVVMLVWVGFLFVMARGNPEEISKARSALIWTLIGGLILLGAQAISEVLQATVREL